MSEISGLIPAGSHGAATAPTGARLDASTFAEALRTPSGFDDDRAGAKSALAGARADMSLSPNETAQKAGHAIHAYVRANAQDYVDGMFDGPTRIHGPTNGLYDVVAEALGRDIADADGNIESDVQRGILLMLDAMRVDRRDFLTGNERRFAMDLLKTVDVGRYYLRDGSGGN